MIKDFDVRRATTDDGWAIAVLLDEFNREFDCDTPGPRVLAGRLQKLLEQDSTHCYLYGEPAIALALLSLRTNVWHDGPVATLDEFYVKPSARSNGIGSAVLAECEQSLRRCNVRLMEINVDGVDVDAQRFYVRHGYSNTDPGQPEPMFYFYKELE